MATGVGVGMWDHIVCSHAYNMQAYQVRNTRVHMHQVEALTNLLYYVYKVLTFY